MSAKNKMFQPGAILHEVIVGTLRSSGTSLAAWCDRNGIHPAVVRQATYGQSGGDKGQALLERLINDAGPELVLAAYRKRMILEAQKLEEAAA